jgi:hypothetical protein
MKKILMFSLFLSFMLVSLLKIGLVNAENTIYIRPDGAAEGTDIMELKAQSYKSNFSNC